MQRENNRIRYFLVTAKCGHVGKGYYIPITFAVVSESKQTAAAFTRELGRVKHHHKDAIIDVAEVMWEEYRAQSFHNARDPYLNISYGQKFKLPLSDLAERILPEPEKKNYKKKAEPTDKDIYCGKERIRNPRKWARLYVA